MSLRALTLLPAVRSAARSSPVVVVVARRSSSPSGATPPPFKQPQPSPEASPEAPPKPKKAPRVTRVRLSPRVVVKPLPAMIEWRTKLKRGKEVRVDHAALLFEEGQFPGEIARQILYQGRPVMCATVCAYLVDKALRDETFHQMLDRNWARAALEPTSIFHGCASLAEGIEVKKRFEEERAAAQAARRKRKALDAQAGPDKPQ